jgi:glycosyltransferase involved in cell wall biosynthesis
VLREVLNDTNAVLCDPEDIEAWAHALVRARADAAWREQISSQAWRDVQQYSWRRRVQRIVAAL